MSTWKTRIKKNKDGILWEGCNVMRLKPSILLTWASVEKEREWESGWENQWSESILAQQAWAHAVLNYRWCLVFWCSYWEDCWDGELISPFHPVMPLLFWFCFAGTQCWDFVFLFPQLLDGVKMVKISRWTSVRKTRISLNLPPRLYKITPLNNKQ